MQPYLIKENGFVSITFIGPKTILDKIIEKHKLSLLEVGILKKYLEHIHKESKEKFLDNVLKNDRSYLDQFLDTELEEFGQSQNWRETDFKVLKITHKDLYNLQSTGESTKLLLLYQGLLAKIKEAKEDKKIIYDIFDYDPNLSISIIEKRKYFFELFIKFIDKLKKSNFKIFVDNVFDKGINGIQLFKGVTNIKISRQYKKIGENIIPMNESVKKNFQKQK